MVSNGAEPDGSSAAPDPRPKVDTLGDPEEGEGEICFICANPIIHRSIAPCNHITCHICALRMRALYKTKDCPHCRVSASLLPRPLLVPFNGKC